MVTPFEPGQVDGAAYTLKIGGEAYVSPEAGQRGVPEIQRLHTKQSFAIPPGQFAFLLTREEVSVPYDLLALINIKNSLKVQGLVNVSGFHVDPGYSGKLIFAVFNAGPKTLLLREAEDAFLIWFARLEEPTANYARKKKGYYNISSEMASNIPRESASVNTLLARIESLERFRRSVLTVLATLLTLAVSLTASFLAGFWEG